MLEEKRKLPRFHITPCQFHESTTVKNFSVQDISLGGLSIRLVERMDLPHFAVGSLHLGLVKVEGLKTECQFRVKYIRGTLIGSEWHELSSELKKHLQILSLPETIGPEMKQYDLSDLAGMTWFHHPVGIDLLIYPFGRWIAYVHQGFVQWEGETGLRTGKTMAEDEEGYAHGIVRLETRLLEFDETPDSLLLKWVQSLIEKMSHLTPELKKLVSSHLKGAI